MTPTPREPMEPGAEACPDYDALVQSAREALNAMPDLPPSRWVEIRAGVDESMQRYRNGGTGWAWAAVAVASAAALLLSLSPAPTQPMEEESVTTVAAVQAPAPRVAATSTTPAHQPGQSLTADGASRTFDAFGRHSLTLDAGGTMEVVAWSPRDLAVRLSSGRVTADIAKAFPGERVQIETATAFIRVVGTQFSVTYEPTGGTRVDVTEGIVEVRAKHDASAKPTRVTAGQTHRVEAAQAPADAVQAPSSPTTTRKRARSRAADKDDGGLRIIEIDVPPQQGPNAR